MVHSVFYNKVLEYINAFEKTDDFLRLSMLSDSDEPVEFLVEDWKGVYMIKYFVGFVLGCKYHFDFHIWVDSDVLSSYTIFAEDNMTFHIQTCSKSDIMFENLRYVSEDEKDFLFGKLHLTCGELSYNSYLTSLQGRYVRKLGALGIRVENMYLTVNDSMLEPSVSDSLIDYCKELFKYCDSVILRADEYLKFELRELVLSSGLTKLFICDMDYAPVFDDDLSKQIYLRKSGKWV